MLENLPYIIFILLIIAISFIAKRIAAKVFEASDLTDFALNITGTFIIKVSLDNVIIDVNEPFLKYSNFKKDDLVNKLSFSDLVSQSSSLEYKSFLAKLYSKGSCETDIAIVTKDNKEILISVFAKALKNQRGNLYYVFVCKDISEFYYERDFANSFAEGRILNRELAESDSIIDKNFSYYFHGIERLRESESKHKFLIDSMNIGMMEYDIANNVFYFSDKCKQLLEKDFSTSNADIKEYLISKIHKEDYYKVVKNIYLAISNKVESFKSNFRLVNEDKSYTYIEFFGKLTYSREGNVINLAGSLSDISSACIYQEKIKKLAYYDNLTGLYNRTYMEEYVDILYKNNPNSRAAFIFLDIDDFKFINDSFGHYFGDRVICEMAARIRSISKNYIVSRFSGDEIAIFIQDYINLENLINYVDLLSGTLNISYEDSEVSYSVEASIGIAISPENGKDFENLLKCADIAMNRVKNMGKNRYLFFDKRMQEQLKEKIDLEMDLKLAVNSCDELFLFLQPQYDIASGKLSGFEALSRWISKKRGNVSPTVFIPIAEETRLIVPLGKWVLRESCIVLKKLQESGHDDIKISVNLSPIQLIDSHLIDYIKDIIEETKINTTKLEIEITETALMENFETNLKKLFELREMGIAMALDDFGTGYSSLTYLKTLPMTSIKIDKSFIDNVSTSNIDKRITEKIIELSHVLDFNTIAEGVETKEQLDFVKSMGCDIVQGYFGGVPIAKDDIFSALDNNLYSYFSDEL